MCMCGKSRAVREIVVTCKISYLKVKFIRLNKIIIFFIFLFGLTVVLKNVFNLLV